MINLRIFNHDDKDLIKNWFVDDDLGNKFIPSYKEESFFELLDGKNRVVYIVNKDDQPIGFLDLEILDNKANFAFYVSKEFRGFGYGKEILKNMLHLPEIKTLDRIECGVENDNIGSIKILEDFGFERVELDKDGFIKYQFILSR